MNERVFQTSSEVSAETQEYLGQFDVHVLLDLDKTIIDGNYQPTVPIDQLKDTLVRGREKKILFGLHSDTPGIALRKWAVEFGLVDENGEVNVPLIGELGGTLELPSMSEKVIAVSGADTYFAQLKAQFRRKVEEERGIPWHEGDIVNEKRQGTKYPDMGDRGVFVNGMREVSLGVWFWRLKQDGSIYHDDEYYAEMTDLLTAQIDELAGEGRAIDLKDPYDYNRDYSIAIIQTAFPDKTNAYQRYTGWVPGVDSKRFFMIGDSTSDLIDDPDVTTLAVANAKPALKEAVGPDNVSTQEYTAGVIEHIDRIIAQM